MKFNKTLILVAVAYNLLGTVGCEKWQAKPSWPKLTEQGITNTSNDFSTAFNDFRTNVILTQPPPTSLLEITSTDKLVMSVDCPFWTLDACPAPTNANDVVIKLTTADGKKWICKWEEAK